MLSQDISTEVGRTSAYWNQFRQRLKDTQSHWRGREHLYLELVRGVVVENIELYTNFVLQHTGVDVKTGRRISPSPQSHFSPWQRNFLVNVKHLAHDWMAVGSTVGKAEQAAKRAGNDPVLAAYNAFFQAMQTVFAAGTLALMQELEGSEMEKTTLLLSGWADAHLSLQGDRAARLLQALQSKGQGKQDGDALRQRLREELPGAVLEAVEEWKPGQELFCPDKPVVAPGKKSAGRKPRTFRSRVARSIERLGTDRPHAQLHEDKVHEDKVHEDQMHEDQVSGTAAKTSASSVAVSPASRQASETWAASSKFRKFWDAWVTEAKLGPHEQQIADYLRANPDCLVPESLQTNGRLKTRRGTWTDIAATLGRSSEQVRQEGQRLVKKMERSRSNVNPM